MVSILKKLSFFLLLVLFCMSFKYKTQTWELGWPGLGGGTIILGIIGVIFLFKLNNTLRQLCVQKGIHVSRIKQYDKYFWIAFILTLFHFSWYGENLTEGEFDPQWSIIWSDNTWQVPFLFALFAVIFLYKIYVLLNLLLADTNSL